MNLLVLGLNHKTAPIHIRELLAFTEEDQVHFTQDARHLGCDEVLILSTCNRVELYGATSRSSLKELKTKRALEQNLVSLLADKGALSLEELTPHIYIHSGEEALVHLFRVAASLDSMVVGEPQILGQLKAAFERYREAQLTGKTLDRLMERAFLVARRVRAQTGIGRNVVSISSIAVHLARQIFDDLSNRNVLLIGAGEMGELAARHLKQEGVQNLFVANRDFQRAADLASRLHGRPRRLDELSDLLTQVDIVITSTGSRDYLITPKLAQRTLKIRKYRPLFLIDIAVPRNIDPKVNEVDNVYVYDVDDLTQIAEENRAHRAREAQAAEQMVLDEVQRLNSQQTQRQLNPTIVEVREHIHQIKSRELEWLSGRLQDLDPTHQKIVKQFGERLTNKILHEVITNLKDLSDHPNHELVLEITHRLFGIDQTK